MKYCHAATMVIKGIDVTHWSSAKIHAYPWLNGIFQAE
jgi:hypothetical protein